MSGPWRIALPAAVLLIILGGLAVFPSAGNAAESVTTVTGIVESVSGNSVFLYGRGYDLAGVAIVNPSGRRLSIADIVSGKKVDLFFRSGRLASVVVYNPMVE